MKGTHCDDLLLHHAFKWTSSLRQCHCLSIHVVPAYILSDRTLLDMLIRILSLDNLWLCYSGLAPYVALNAEVDPFLAYLFHRQP